MSISDPIIWYQRQRSIEDLWYGSADLTPPLVVYPPIVTPSIYMSEQIYHPQFGSLVRIEGHLNF